MGVERRYAALTARIARSLRALRGAGRLRRQLARIERTLESEARLAAMFATFNALCRGERPSGAEQLPRRFGWLRSCWVRPRAWITPAIAVAAMAVVIVGGLLLSAGLHAQSRPCLMLTAAGLPAAAPVAVPSTSAAAAQSRAAASHETLCSAYPANK